MTKRGTGRATITFVTCEDACCAIRLFNQKPLNPSKPKKFIMTVRIATPPEKNPFADKLVSQNEINPQWNHSSAGNTSKRNKSWTNSASRIKCCSSYTSNKSPQRRLIPVFLHQFPSSIPQLLKKRTRRSNETGSTNPKPGTRRKTTKRTSGKTRKSTFFLTWSQGRTLALRRNLLHLETSIR